MLRYFIPGRRWVISLIILVIASTSMFGNTELDKGATLRFNKDFSLKKTSELVKVSYVNPEGKTIEYAFEDFNADVLLYVYRRINQKQIVSSLSAKYHLSETECRRMVKKAINTLENWEIVQWT